jgi:thiol-disulfide isomerase/thioredoxin
MNINKILQSLSPTQWIYRYISILIVGAIWIFASRSLPGTTMNGAIPAPHAGFMAPDFSLRSSLNETITLSELRGQPILINIWASWCSPCRAEMPAMEHVYQEYKDQGFIILAVNATNQDDSDKALAFAQEYGLSFPILFDTDGGVSQKYRVRALPTSFFVDQQGIIQEVVVGGPMAEALLRIRVEELVNPKIGNEK